MRNFNKNVLSASDHLSTNGEQIDAGQLISASFHAYFGDTNAAGTFKLQASNDVCASGNVAANFTVSNWVDIPSQTANITSGASAILTIAQSAYRWLRAVYTSTATGVQHVVTVADVAGSLNNTYFLLNSANSGTSYYVWINVNSAGTDPMIAGRTGVEVDVATSDTAATIAAAIAAAIDPLANFASTATGSNVTITNSASGPFVAASDGIVPTGFTFSITAGGTSTVNVNMNVLSV